MEIEALGTPSHTRTLSVRVSHAGADHVRAAGTIIDLRKRGLVPMAGDLQTSGVIHHMKVDARIAREGPAFETIVAEQPTVAFEPREGTGGECCRDPVKSIEALAGTALDADFAKRLGLAIGGPRGCSHVLTLAQLLGATARTALEADVEQFGPAPQRAEGQRIFQRSLSLDGLEDGDRGLSLSLQLADVHFAPVGSVEDPLERLTRQREIRVHASIDLTQMTIREIGAGERLSEAADFHDAEWQSRDVSFLEGHSALGGMAKTLFSKLTDTQEERPLMDTLLNLAPAVIQCIPALTTHWRRWREAAGSGKGGGPSMMAGGGMTDSCYMWRADGYMSERMAQVMKGMRR